MTRDVLNCSIFTLKKHAVGQRPVNSVPCSAQRVASVGFAPAAPQPFVGFVPSEPPAGSVQPAKLLAFERPAYRCRCPHPRKDGRQDLQHLFVESARPFALRRRGRVVAAEGVERFEDGGHAALQCDEHPEIPVAGVAESFVFPCRRQCRTAEDGHAGVVEFVAAQQVPQHEASPVHAAYGTSRMADFPERPSLRVDRAAQRVGQYARGIGIELRHAAFEERRIGVVVALGDPDVLSLREREPLAPLGEGRTAVAVVVDDLLDARVVPVTFDHLAAPVRRAVVEQHYLEIGVGLREHRVDALPEIGRVTIVGFRYGLSYLMPSSCIS